MGSAIPRGMGIENLRLESRFLQDSGYPLNFNTPVSSGGAATTAVNSGGNMASDTSTPPVTAPQLMGAGGLTTGEGVAIAGGAMGVGFLMQGISSWMQSNNQAEVAKEQLQVNLAGINAANETARELSRDRLEGLRDASADRLDAIKAQVDANKTQMMYYLEGRRDDNNAKVEIAFENAKVALAQVVSTEKIGLAQVKNQAKQIENDRLAIMYQGTDTSGFRSS